MGGEIGKPGGSSPHNKGGSAGAAVNAGLGVDSAGQAGKGGSTGVEDASAGSDTGEGSAGEGAAGSPDGTVSAATCSAKDPIGPSGTYVPPQYTVACGPRPIFTSPFSKNSIWNLPLGDGARYVDCNLGVMGACNVDNDLVYREVASDPTHQVFRHDHQGGVDGMGGTGKLLHIPDAFTYAGGPNNGGAFLDINGHTFKEFSAFAREPRGSDPIAWDFGTTEIDEQGIIGGHAGGGLSVVGGTLRPGELTRSGPIRHALKIELDWAVLSPDWPGKFRWPARNSDGNGANNYGGNVKALTMGSLVAIRPDVDLDAIAWKTPFGRRIAQAFQDYGAYVVDTTGNYWKWNNGGYTLALCAQNESIDEVKSTYGIDFRSGWGGGGTGWTSDMAEIYKRLAVVDNNSATGIGGGGTPRKPLAPDFAE